MFSLELENEYGQVVDIDDGKRYIITGVTGLHPPSAMIYTSKSPNKKGSKYNGSTLNERFINISIKLLGDIQKNRNTLYDWIDTEQYVKIRYRGDEKNVYCEGHVEECPFETFTNNEIINIAIICENPYWQDLEAMSIAISDQIAHFVFPFAIDNTGIPFSSLKETNETVIFNAGAETGARFIIQCKGDVKNFVIFNSTDAARNFKLNTTLEAGWVVIIDTESSPKTCKAYLNDGSEINLMRYVGKAPTWLTLRRGTNIFGFTAESDLSNAEVSINFTNKYLGV